MRIALPTIPVIVRHIKEVVEFVFVASYALILYLINRQPRRVVIYYHGIPKAEITGFRTQMAYLAGNCAVIKPSEIKIADSNRRDHLVAITFDDAFVTIKENAVPILQEYRLPAGIFVPVDNLGRKPVWINGNSIDKDEVVMTKQQIVELDRKGFEIFSHTLSHPVLTEISNCELEAELANSKHALEKTIGHEVYGISYPHGAYDLRVCDTAKRVGYRLGFTIEPQIVNNCTDDMQIGRFRVSPQDNLLKFKLKVTGAYQATRLLKKIRRLITGLFIRS
jgi:peptidoglycan/xylan/chitin deacetylase (PgdA/CDA1 family)